MKMFVENFTTETLENNIVLVFTLLLAFFIATFIMLELLCDQKFEELEYYDEDGEENEEEDAEEDAEEDEEMEEEDAEDDEDYDDDEEMDEDDEENDDQNIPFACRARVNDKIVRHGLFDGRTYTFEFDNGLHAYSPSAACQVILKRRRTTNSWQGPSHVYLYLNNKWVVFRETPYY